MAGNESAYGELLGEYFSVVAEIAPLLDGSGRPPGDRSEEYTRLREWKAALRTALDNATPDHETTDVESILEEALAGSNT